MNMQIDFPSEVINSLQQRINQLEGQIERLKREQDDGLALEVSNALRRLRFHGVVPLLVAPGGIDKLAEDVSKYSPVLSKAVHEVWPVETSSLQASTIADIMATANNGMSRWA